MKKLVWTTLLVSGLAGVMAQGAFAQQDSVKRKSTFGLSNGLISVSIHGKDTTAKVKAPHGRFTGGITFTRLDIGFSRLIDNGSFSLSKENEFLDYTGGKTSTVSFDILQLGYRFNPHFKIYMSGGFDWTMIRLKRNITLEKNSPTMSYVEEDIQFSKNRLSNSYVHIPLNFELRSKENAHGKRFTFVFGPEVGFLLNGKVKQVSKEKGKEKFKDDYNFEPFRYGGTLRIGYGGLGIFTKYYMSDMFTTTAQKGLKNMSFGVTFGLN
ncbi:outer membrane beta-barrel protein [Pedobacter gandavensis]|uniref:Outer membrane beta-barrel protein n=1 Tax=Pedobacter gandavensis TaxID=2679963 RepID=A0ABR6F2L7_9SPHI|nr:outer membrane beta-barrel protein [Pedobacter gandavensis]MBB2151785.1 outer membrane beta-barrel protein [Pedobacter gandavensis]